MEELKQIEFESIFTKDKTEEAISFLETKKDSCGVDGIYLSELREYWTINGNDILEILKNEKYTPGLVKKVEIVNYKGKKRKIAMFNSIDRMILRCLAQNIQAAYDPVLDEHCFAYRNGFGVEAAVSRTADYLEEGYLWTAKLDIDCFFDNIRLYKLEEQLNELISDDRVVRLVKKYLHLDVEDEGLVKRQGLGLIQGNPLSPFLSNLYLNPFDQIMTERGIRFCRFGDDIMFHFKTPEEAGTHIEEARTILQEEYGLNLNEQKTGVFEGIDQKYLGYRFRLDKKTHKVTAIKKEKKRDVTYYKWNRDVIKKTDRNYHIINDGILTKRDYTLLFENEDGKKCIPVETARALNIHSDVIFSSGFFQFAGEKNLDVNMFDRYGNFIGSFSPANNGYKGLTMLKQTELYSDQRRRLVIARALEIGAMHNLRSNLRYYAKHRSSYRFKEAIDGLSGIISEMNSDKDINALMLTEARGRELYYSMFNEIITEEGFHYSGRNRRPPKDPLNALISFGNVYIYNRVATEIHKTSLDIRIGIIHATNTRSQTLNLDIAEIFKPLIVDRTIFTLINKKMIQADEHFEKTEEGGVYLNPAGKRLFINELDDKIYTKVTERNRPISYDTRIREEVSKVFRAIMYDEKYKPYKYQ